MIKLSVIIPTYNPDAGRLSRVLTALSDQTLEKDSWELILVDNNSAERLDSQLSIDWHPAAKIVMEPRPGLTYARLRGFGAAVGNIVVLIDDDNVACPDYLQQIITIFENNPDLGAIGGKSLPEFATPPPPWIVEFQASLALRDLGEEIVKNKWDGRYPNFAPIGAGMACRKTAVLAYMEQAAKDKAPLKDRTEGSLSSGGDNDMVLEILKAGWSTAYYPSLVIRHLIPEERLQAGYMARLIEQTNRSWIAVLDRHGINPWSKIPAWTTPFRKAKAWFYLGAWRNEKQYIRWRGTCGTFDGLSDKVVK